MDAMIEAFTYQRPPSKRQKLNGRKEKGRKCTKGGGLNKLCHISHNQGKWKRLRPKRTERKNLHYYKLNVAYIWKRFLCQPAHLTLNRRRRFRKKRFFSPSASFVKQLSKWAGEEREMIIIRRIFCRCKKGLREKYIFQIELSSFRCGHKTVLDLFW